MEEHAKKLSLNPAAVEHARQLIQQGKINRERDNWSEDKPNPALENAFLSDHNINEYSKWFLATVDGTNPDTKEHYEFPYGNFDEVFCSGLIAAKQRAGQFKHTEVEQAAAMLLDMLGE